MTTGRLAIVFAAAVLVVPAVAQTPSTVSGPDRRDHAEHRAEWRAKIASHERQEASDVALLLRLKPDQLAAYQTWVASLHPPGGEQDGGDWNHSGMTEGSPQTLPQQLDRMQARIAERDQKVRAHLDATRRFYASLSPDQQALFDALMRLRHGGGMHGGMHRWGMRGGEGGPPLGGPGHSPPPPGT